MNSGKVTLKKIKSIWDEVRLKGKPGAYWGTLRGHRAPFCFDHFRVQDADEATRLIIEEFYYYYPSQDETKQGY